MAGAVAGTVSLDVLTGPSWQGSKTQDEWISAEGREDMVLAQGDTRVMQALRMWCPLETTDGGQLIWTELNASLPQFLEREETIQLACRRFNVYVPALCMQFKFVATA